MKVNDNEVTFVVGTYADMFNRKAVLAYTSEGELYGDVTINLPKYSLESGESFLSADCPDLINEMVKEGYLELTDSIKINYATYKIGRFTQKFMDEFEKEDYEYSKMNESDFECSPRQMAEKLMEFNRDLSDSDEDEINEEIDYLAELFSDLQESEKYNALMHHLDLMFSHEIFQ